VVADADTDEVVAEMQQSLADGSDTGWVDIKKKKMGDAFAIIRIPRFGKNYAKPVREGTQKPILMRGVGHYTESQDPGELGNFAVAGHRTTYGKPFNRIAELKKGDNIIIETKETFFVYEIVSHEIVLEKNGEVVWPVPWEPGAEPVEAMITMTSCHPEFRSIQRYVQHGKLVDQFANNGKLPEKYLEVK
jgi:sortase A